MFDDRIDRTAQQLTEGAPAEDFRARVLNRIEPGQRRNSIVAWSAVAAAAAVVIVAGVLTLQHTRNVPTPSAPSASAAPAPLAPLAPSERERVEGSERERVEGSERERVEGSERSESRGPAPPAPPALPAPSAIPPGFEPIASEPLAISSIEIADLAPMDPPELRALSIEPIYTAPLDAAMEQR